MVDPVKIDWGDVFTSFVAGSIAAIGSLFGWFNKKLSGVHTRINEMEHRVNLYAVHIGVQEEQHEANKQRLDGIEKSLDAIDGKQDSQMKLLMEMSRRAR